MDPKRAKMFKIQNDVYWFILLEKKENILLISTDTFVEKINTLVSAFNNPTQSPA
jgi:hypothetical protein